MHGIIVSKMIYQPENIYSFLIIFRHPFPFFFYLFFRVGLKSTVIILSGSLLAMSHNHHVSLPCISEREERNDPSPIHTCGYGTKPPFPRKIPLPSQAPFDASLRGGHPNVKYAAYARKNLYHPTGLQRTGSSPSLRPTIRPDWTSRSADRISRLPASLRGVVPSG